MKKRIVALILVLALTMGLTGGLVFAADGEDSSDTVSGTCGDNLTWVLEDGVLTISGTGKMDNDFEKEDYVAMPWADYRWDITEVVIDEGVTNIGNFAFYYCKSLISIEIPEGVTSIGAYAFASCYSLESISLPSTLTNIGNFAFYNCESLTSIEIPEGVTSIGDSAFSDCSSLAGVSLPSTMTSIGDYAFAYCTSLTGIEIPENCEVGDRVFIGCIGLADEDGFIIVENVLYTYAGTEADVVIPEGVTSIEDGAFTDYSVGNSMFGGIYVSSTFYTTSITSVSIPDSVTNIGNEVFAFCTSLEDIVIPSGVTTIGDNVFDWDISLESITFEGDAPELESYSDEYYGLGDGLKEGLTVYYYDDAEGWTDEYKTTLAGNADVIWVELDRESGEVVSTSDSGTSLSIIDSETTASYTLGSGGGAVITVDADIADFISVTVDGTVLTQDVDYTVTEGSTIITFTESFLETLSEGDHDVVIAFTGGDVQTTLSVEASESSSGSDDADDSGDSGESEAADSSNDSGESEDADDSSAAEVGDASNLALWTALGLLAALGLIGAGLRKRITG